MEGRERGKKVNSVRCSRFYAFSGLVTKSCKTRATPWTVACQAPLSMGFSRKEYWSGLPFPSSGYLPDSEIEPESPALQGDSLLSYEGNPHPLFLNPFAHIKNYSVFTVLIYFPHRVGIFLLSLHLAREYS